MNDDRVWEFETSLWTADAARYREAIDPECLMVVPQPPFVLSGEQAVAAVSATPRWTTVAMREQKIARPQEGLIVVAYAVRAEREGTDPYDAYCTSTYRRMEHEVWRVVQHQQTPPLATG